MTTNTRYILTKESPHGITLYAEVARDGFVVWRVARVKATPMTRMRANEIGQRMAHDRVTVFMEQA